MSARDSLIAYGYVLNDDGKYRKPGKQTQVWQDLGDGKGWLRFDPDGKGDEVPEVYKIAAAYEGTSGLSKLHHPGSFEWVWPEEEVERIYGAAVEAEQARLRIAMERKGLVSGDRPAAPAIEGMTEDQLASMQNAQAGQAAAAEPATEDKRHWWQR